MTQAFRRTLFLFRRDLRLQDNTGLLFALQSSQEVVPAFIFTPEQIEENPYRSDHCLKFMLESLEDLQAQLYDKRAQLYLFKGKYLDVVKRLIGELQIDAVCVNRDYTPYSIRRDLNIERLCKELGIAFHAFEDTLLHSPEKTRKSDGTPYTVFTPYYKNALKIAVRTIDRSVLQNYFRGEIAFAEPKEILSLRSSDLHVENSLKGGRTAGLTLLQKAEQLLDYQAMRDFPGKEYSSHLSPYLKFNVCSVREVYEALSGNPELQRSLYWRDFFTSIAYFFPHVFGSAFHQKFDRLKWDDDLEAFERWKTGMTGFPIIDAGMRQMNATGFMHNRVRMLTAAFLIKDLHIDWRWGERYFAQTLVDYDPAVNNGNWQWAASTGCDAQPYFRIFNPWTQQRKFDPDCIYIKKWIPELKALPAETIHHWFQAEKRSGINYPLPMLDHQIEAKKALAKYAHNVVGVL